MQEIWKEVEGTCGKIFVSNLGQIMSKLSDPEGRILKTSPNPKGYLTVSVTVNRQKKSIKVHREVAKNFIPNPDNKPQVNHIDGNKRNNSVENLEWVTNQENANHAIRTGLWNTFLEGAKRVNDEKKVKIIATKDNRVLRFNSMSEAEKAIGTKHINAVIKGQRSHAKGWHFAYESEVV